MNLAAPWPVPKAPQGATAPTLGATALKKGPRYGTAIQPMWSKHFQ